MIKRIKELSKLKEWLNHFPVVALLGPRQCGKTTLAKQASADHYFDLENPRDWARFDTPQLTLESLEGTIVIDEIQRRPELFPLIRFLVDENPKQRYLILGSASRDLIQQGSETLAGRIAFMHLGGFTLQEVEECDLKSLWFRGGFPRSFLASSDALSNDWRENYIRTFLERDIPQLGISLASESLRRFWMMLSHYHGQTLNYSELGRSFGVSDVTVKKYIDILKGTFMVRIVPPWFANTSKRVVKSPKLYLSDSGLFHSLQGIESEHDLFGHPKLGASWEGFAVEMIIRMLRLPSDNIYFWSVHSGAEVDLYWRAHGKNWGIEIKYADAPRRTVSMQAAVKELDLAHLWVVYPGTTSYPLSEKISVLPLTQVDKIETQTASK